MSATLAAGPGASNSHAMSTMVMSDRNKLSGVTPMKSSSMPALLHMFSPPPLAKNVCPVDNGSDDIYEVTQQHEVQDYEFVDPAKLRESQLIQDDDIDQVCLSVCTCVHYCMVQKCLWCELFIISDLMHTTQ